MPARRVPVAPLVGGGGRHHDLVADTGCDLVIASGTAVGLHRLVRVNVPDLVRRRSWCPRSPEERPEHQCKAPTASAAITNDEVAAARDVRSKRIEAHAATVAAARWRDRRLRGESDHGESARGAARRRRVVDAESSPEEERDQRRHVERAHRAVFDEVAVRADDRVLVVTGAGDGFCAGVDLTDSGMVQTAGGRLDYVRKVGRCSRRRSTTFPSRRSRR